MHYQKKNKSSAVGFGWVSSEIWTLSPEFLWFLMMQNRVTDVAGFEIRDHRKCIRQENKIRKNANARKKAEQKNGQ